MTSYLSIICRRTTPPKTDFRLLTKTEKADISLINKDKFWEVPKKALSFDYIEIGKASDEKFSREVMTFFDDTGRVISKVFRENGRNVKQRLYRYDDNKKFITNMLFDASRVAEKAENYLYNLGGIWKKNFELTQWITKIPEWAKDGKIPTELHTRHVDFVPQTEEATKITLTQYPINLGIGNGQKKTVSGEVDNSKGFLKIKNATYENLNIDCNDKYLKYRFFDLHTPEGIIAVTKGLLEEKGLGELNISVIPNSSEVPDKYYGFFDSFIREIHFSKTITQSNVPFLEIIGSIAHEVEHARQFSLIGRRGNGMSKYETDALKKLGEITDPEEQLEALKFFIARCKYTPFGEEYKNNYLEVKARAAGEETAKEFMESKDNFEFFEQFN